MREFKDLLAEMLKNPSVWGSYHAETAREFSRGESERTLSHDEAVIKMLRDEPELAGHYLRAALADINEEGGQEGFCIAAQHVSKSWVQYPEIDPALLAAVQLPNTGDEKQDYEYALALVECLLCIDELNPLIDGLCKQIEAYEMKDPELARFLLETRQNPSDKPKG